MNAMKVAICDDNRADRDILENYLHAYCENKNFLFEISHFDSGEAFLSVDRSSFALVFMDIFMDEMNGMETAKALLKENPHIGIIFCSTSGEFAAESYDVSALYYLIKPIYKEKLYPILDRFILRREHSRVLKVKIGRSEDSVLVRDILYAEAMGKKTVLHMRNGENIVVSMSMALLSEELKEPDFIRSIRYAIVNVRYIAEVPTDRITLKDGTEIAIGRGAREHVREAFAEYKWQSLSGDTRRGGL